MLLLDFYRTFQIGCYNGFIVIRLVVIENAVASCEKHRGVTHTRSLSQPEYDPGTSAFS